MGAGGGAPVSGVGSGVHHRPAYSPRVRHLVGDPRPPLRQSRSPPRHPVASRHPQGHRHRRGLAGGPVAGAGRVRVDRGLRRPRGPAPVGEGAGNSCSNTSSRSSTTGTTWSGCPSSPPCSSSCGGRCAAILARAPRSNACCSSTRARPAHGRCDCGARPPRPGPAASAPRSARWARARASRRSCCRAGWLRAPRWSVPMRQGARPAESDPFACALSAGL